LSEQRESLEEYKKKLEDDEIRKQKDGKISPVTSDNMGFLGSLDDLDSKSLSSLNELQFAKWINSISKNSGALNILHDQDITNGKTLANFVKRKGELGLDSISLKQGVITEIMEKYENQKSQKLEELTETGKYPMQVIGTLDQNDNARISEPALKETGISVMVEPLNTSSFILSTKILGTGSFGRVIEGKFHGSRVAIKVLSGNVDLTTFTKEVQHLLKLRHPCCVTVLGYVIIPEPAMVMKLYPFNLHDVLHKGSTLMLDKRQAITKDIIHGLMYLHSIPMIHRDLKPANILLTNEFHAKISDFGTAKVIGGANSFILTQSVQLVGTPFYMAPETANNLSYSTASDMYALGIIIYEIFEQKIPYSDYDFSNQNPISILNNILQRNLRPKFNANINISLKDLIEKLWDQDIEKRPSLAYTENVIESLQN